ncbi:MAG: hypothetical protein IT443_11970 [Phycisphaeraceae bacterium]|nr:hypothetical protein [Phycisphaeraceae bacterium]
MDTASEPKKRKVPNFPRQLAVAVAPPWDPTRDRLRVEEVAAYLKHQYALRVSTKRVLEWAELGVKGADNTFNFLPIVKMAKRRFVKKDELLKFLEIVR